MDPLYLLTRVPLRGLRRCRVPLDTREVTSFGEEAHAREGGVTTRAIDGIWQVVEALYRTGVYPALQVCIRRHDRVILHRAIGHASGNAPDDPEDAPKIPVTIETPFAIYSASKAVTAMLIHKLDERRVFHLEDPVSDFIPEFNVKGKDRITIRHLLAHRAGIPNLPPEALDLSILTDPRRVVEILAGMELRSQPGRMLAYHAVTGGFVLAEVVRRATGLDIRAALEKEIVEPLGFRWTRYGVSPEDVGQVAINAVTGPRPPPPLRGMLRRALGGEIEDLVRISNDPRFLTGVIPSANVVSTADELSSFFQCLLREGMHGEERVFEPRTIRHATSEQSYWDRKKTLLWALICIT